MSTNGSHGVVTGSGVLNGTRVIELTTSIAVAHCGRLFADHGADVISVEGISGGALRVVGPHSRSGMSVSTSAFYETLSFSKRSIALDYFSPFGRDLLQRLLATADVVVHGWRPSELQAAGLGGEHKVGIGPGTTVSITPFGQTGPYSEYLADDLVCCAAGNVAFGIGAKDGRPLKFPLSLASYEAGAMGFLGGISDVVGRVRTTHKGPTLVDVAIVDVLSSMFSTGITAYPYRGVSGRRNGNHGAALYPDVFLPCADGYVGIVCNQLQQWIRFLDLLGSPEWVENPRYRDRRRMTEDYPEEVDALLVPWLKERTREEIFRICRERDVPVAPSYTIPELLVHPHLVDRAAFREFRLFDGETILLPGWPAVFSDIEVMPWRRSPRYGEHTDEILGEELGVSAEQRSLLYATAVIS